MVEDSVDCYKWEESQKGLFFLPEEKINATKSVLIFLNLVETLANMACHTGDHTIPSLSPILLSEIQQPKLEEPFKPINTVIKRSHL